jgi:hypothetical protein
MKTATDYYIGIDIRTWIDDILKEENKIKNRTAMDKDEKNSRKVRIAQPSCSTR